MCVSQKKPLFPVAAPTSSTDHSAVAAAASAAKRRSGAHSPTGSVILSPTPPPRRKEAAVPANGAQQNGSHGHDSSAVAEHHQRGRPKTKKQDLMAAQGRVSSEVNLGSRSHGGKPRQVELVRKEKRSHSLTPNPDTLKNVRGKPQSEATIRTLLFVFYFHDFLVVQVILFW